MSFTFLSSHTTILCVVLFIAILAFLEIGYQLGEWQNRRYPDHKSVAGGPIEAGMLALLGLLLAFTFAAAHSRFEERRRLIADEANAIGTAYLRLDLLPAAEQPALREGFRNYLDTRLRAYRDIPNLKQVNLELARAARLQKEIWHHAQIATRAEAWPPAAILLLPALNEMIDITTTRTMMAKAHTPGLIIVLLFFVSMVTAIMAGYAMARTPGRNWFHRIVFAVIIAMTVYVILDLEFPRMGLIQLNAADEFLIELRQAMQ